MNKLSTFLFAQPSFIEGVARLIDFGNTLQIYNTSLSGEQADALALAADWQVVGDDLEKAILEFQGEAKITDELIIEVRNALMNVK
jgi:hypothetical protein